MENETESNNFTFVASSDCWIDGLDMDHPRSSVGRTLMVYGIVHCYIVFVLGTLGNCVALWCIATCEKITSSIKILLGNVFLPQLLICLVTRVIVVEGLRKRISCDQEGLPKELMIFNEFVYSAWAVIGLVCISVVSVLRVRAVLSTRHEPIRLRVAILIVSAVWIHAFASTAVQLFSESWGIVTDKSSKQILLYLYFSLNVFVPVVITLICYAIMLVSIQRNKRRLAAHSLKTTQILDPATQAMLAVFISNLVLSFPHGVFHLLPDATFSLSVIFHILYSTHFVLDPLLFIWFNRDYRKRILSFIWQDSNKSASSSSTNTTNDISLSTLQKQGEGKEP